LLTSLYVVTMSVCLISTEAFLLGDLSHSEGHALQIMVLCWAMTTGISVYMTLIMFAEYDDMLSFIQRNLGDCCNQSSNKCCGCYCRCCTGYFCGIFNKMLLRASTGIKVLTLMYTGISLNGQSFLFSQ